MDEKYFEHEGLVVEKAMILRSVVQELQALDAEYNITNEETYNRADNEPYSIYFKRKVATIIFEKSFLYTVTILAFMNLFLSISDLFIVPNNPFNVSLLKASLYTNIVIFILFLCEAILRGYYLGFKSYFSSLFNVLDIFLISICLLFDIIYLFDSSAHIRISIYILINFRVIYVIRTLIKLQFQEVDKESLRYTQLEEYHSKLVNTLNQFKDIDDELHKDLALINILIDTASKGKEMDEDAFMLRSKKSWDFLVPPTTPLRIRRFSFSILSKRKTSLL
ncbi:hypothetical protein K502DRAFT_346070 [Neoconidiobolus thromboides FSU 785]|nr:hypothetical protein K502DRAFT_346070 [Neoconidiobolus thromboides FSU 785]